MKGMTRCFPILMTLVLDVVATLTVQAAAPLKVSDFGDLQAAIDAAGDGDTIVVDVDTPGALVDKRLTIRGIPGGGTGGLITGTDLGAIHPQISTGLLLSSGASRSELINLRISEATVGIASDPIVHQVIPADDVTVRGCTIAAHGVAFYLLNFGYGGSGWIIEHNTIDLQGPATPFTSSVGVFLSREWEVTRIAHNKISGTLTGDNVRGVVVLGGADIEIVQNEISINVNDPDQHSGEPVYLAELFDDGLSVPISNVAVSMNDFRGSLTTRGAFGVTYWGPLDANSDLTGLGAFDHIPETSGIPATFSIGGNLSSSSGNRGELSESDVPIDELLMP